VQEICETDQVNLIRLPRTLLNSSGAVILQEACTQIHAHTSTENQKIRPFQVSTTLLDPPAQALDTIFQVSDQVMVENLAVLEDAILELGRGGLECWK
jgi:hypothetical protein